MLGAKSLPQRWFGRDHCSFPKIDSRVILMRIVVTTISWYAGLAVLCGNGMMMLLKVSWISHSNIVRDASGPVCCNARCCDTGHRTTHSGKGKNRFEISENEKKVLSTATTY
jgi:hypothetical protein